MKDERGPDGRVRLSLRPRRPARRGDSRRDDLSLGTRPRRLPRRRRLLRAERIPDHDAAARGARRDRHDRLRSVLRAPRVAAAARPPRVPRGLAGRAVRHARREVLGVRDVVRALGPVLRRELGRHLGAAARRVRPCVVAVDRGAVLRRLADPRAGARAIPAAAVVDRRGARRARGGEPVLAVGAVHARRFGATGTPTGCFWGQRWHSRYPPAARGPSVASR
jgi:hypothetical protein